MQEQHIPAASNHAIPRRVYTTGNVAISEPLDPVENISSQPAEKRTRGYFRRQMIATPRDGIWGTEGGTCGRSVLVRRREDGAIVVVPALCDMWSCRLCGPRRAAWFKRELAAAQGRYALNTFMTLTVATTSCTAEESARLITHWWNLLHLRLMRAYGHFSYLWAHEHTQKRYSHLHLLGSLELEPSELSAMWLQVTGSSFIVDVQPVDSTRASDYLAKYCTEQATLRAQPAYRHMQGKRFYSKSRDIQFTPFRNQAEDPSASGEWRRLDIPYHELLRRARQAGGSEVQRLAVVPSCTLQAEDSDLARMLEGSHESAC